MPGPKTKHAAASRRRHAPRLQVTVSQETYDRAKPGRSGGCAVSESIMETYPNLTRVRTDTAVIRATDSKKGLRYLWRTPDSVARTLLGFDQGLPRPVEPEFTLQSALQVVRVTSSRARTKERAERLADLSERGGRGGPEPEGLSSAHPAPSDSGPAGG